MARTLSGESVHRGEILPAIALAVFASFVKEGTVSVMALFVAKERGTVFGRTVLCPETVSIGNENLEKQ